MQRYEIHLFAEDHRFQLQDDDAASLDAITVDTARLTEVAVTVEIHEARPEIDTASWETIDAASLSINSGRLVVATSSEFFPDAFRITMRRGAYEALVCRGGGRYLVALYPAVERAIDGALNVVRLDASHVAEYRELMLRAYAQAPDAFTSTPEERAAEPESWWIARIADPSGRSVAFGCFDEIGLVGTVTVEFASKPKTRHKAHVIGMFVSPEARGRGAGRLLVQAALDLCRAREGIASVTLTVTEGNEAAIALYRAAGFHPFGVEPMAIRTAGGFRGKVHMQLTLREDV
jgi:RimJ/RimL family protein N-acetyltransferase